MSEKRTHHASMQAISIDEVAGFCLGHWTDAQAGTGCTAIVCREGASAGVDVRGGAPATRETDLLRPEETVERVHAVVLSGGSLFGLEAASGAARELEDRGIGLPVGVATAPIVCSACLFDLAFGSADVRPDKSAGRAAVAAALEADSPLSEGSVGAGTGATVGKILGPQRSMKGGLGARAFSLTGLQVGAVAAVNACGNVVDPRTGKFVAGVRSTETSEILDAEQAMIDMAEGLAMPLDGASQPARENTTISCVITNAALTKAQATKVAQMAADAYAHAIRPAHTTNDGDTIFVLASGAAGAETSWPVDLVGLVATRALEAAIVAGCTQATGLFGIPAAKELCASQRMP